jgi:hypothetical protein
MWNHKSSLTQAKLGRILRRTICGLPVAGIIFASLLPISVRGQQFLVLIALIWFQVFILFEVFAVGK